MFRFNQDIKNFKPFYLASISIYQQYKQMQSLIKQLNKSNFFSTQVTSPTSSSGQKRAFFNSKEELLKKVANRLKSTKRQIKSVQKQYSEIRQKSHRSSVEYDQVKKKSQLIRFKFIKMYQSKRYNLINQQLKIKLVNQKQQFQKSSTERVRLKKNQRQQHLKYLKAQQDDIKNMLQKKNKQNKKNLKNLLQKSQQKVKQFVNINSEKVKSSGQQFMVRKANYLCMKGSKAKFNYMSKLRQQIQIIKGYENLLEQIPGHEASQQILWRKDQIRSPIFVTHSHQEARRPANHQNF